MLNILTASVVALALGVSTEITNSRVSSDYDVHITSSRLGAAIYIGPCYEVDEEEGVVFIRFVDSAVEADITGYLTDDEDSADYTFCTD